MGECDQTRDNGREPLSPPLTRLPRFLANDGYRRTNIAVYGNREARGEIDFSVFMLNVPRERAKDREKRKRRVSWVIKFVGRQSYRLAERQTRTSRRAPTN